MSNFQVTIDDVVNGPTPFFCETMKEAVALAKHSLSVGLKPLYIKSRHTGLTTHIRTNGQFRCAFCNDNLHGKKHCRSCKTPHCFL